MTTHDLGVADVAGPADDGGLTAGDRAALRQLVEAYAFAVDQRDGDWFVSLWTPDARLTVHQGGGPPVSEMQGLDALRTVTAKLTRFQLTHHLVANHRAVERGGVVTGEAYCEAHHLLPLDGHDNLVSHDDLVMGIRYFDRYHRDPDGGWLIAERQCRKLWERHDRVQGHPSPGPR